MRRRQLLVMALSGTIMTLDQTQVQRMHKAESLYPWITIAFVKIMSYAEHLKSGKD